MSSRRFLGRIGFVAGAFAAAGTLGCATNPVTGKQELALINGLDERAQLRAGQAIKRVTGKPMARVSVR